MGKKYKKIETAYNRYNLENISSYFYDQAVAGNYKGMSPQDLADYQLLLEEALELALIEYKKMRSSERETEPMNDRDWDFFTEAKLLDLAAIFLNDIQSGELSWSSVEDVLSVIGNLERTIAMLKKKIENVEDSMGLGTR